MVMLWPFGMSWTAPVDHLIGEPNDAVAVKEQGVELSGRFHGRLGMEFTKDSQSQLNSHR
jgi:hypothetical protein